MKRIALLILIALMALTGVSAGDAYFTLADIGQHPDILIGFFPSYVQAGVGFELPEAIEGNTTDLQLLLGEGFLQRLLWEDPITGENNFDQGLWNKKNALKYNSWTTDLSLRLLQGFLKSPVEGKDLLLLTIAPRVRYEMYSGANKFGPFNIKGNLNDGVDKISSDYDGAIYPELAKGGKAFLGLELMASLKLDMMKDTLHTNDGLWSKIEVKYGPKALNSYLEGFADYITVSFNTVASKTLYSLERNGSSMLSLILIDRVNASWTGGDSVPTFILGPVSLGRKVRGFNTYTYNTEFTAVNNLDLRITGPDAGVDRLAPRLILFLDCGYGWGRIINTEFDPDNFFLASTGVLMEMSFFDFIDLGFEVNYILSDGTKKYTQPEGRVTTNFTFFLDF